MSQTGYKHSARVIAAGLLLIAYSSALPGPASAQNQPPPDQAPQSAPPPPAAAPPPQAQAPAADTQPALSEGQIEQLVAPIALYPDNLLAQVLTASTYPLEVVMAARWRKDNPNVKGDALDAAMQTQSWDPSVKGLTSVPQTLDMMSEQLDWTQQLGEAFLAQPDDISNAVQKLRTKAEATGNLKSSKELKVSRAPPPPPGPGVYVEPYIVIEPVEPDVVYVPVYDPYVVYGAWDYPAYRPFYWRPPGYTYVGVFGFGAAVVVGAALWSNYDWGHRRVYIDTRRYNRFNHTRLSGAGAVRWSHDPRHRGSVGYKNVNLQKQYAKPGATGIPKGPGAGNVKGPGAPKPIVSPKGAVTPKVTTTPKVSGAPKPTIKPTIKPAIKPTPKVTPKPKAVVTSKPVIKPKVNAAPKVVGPPKPRPAAPRGPAPNAGNPKKKKP